MASFSDVWRGIVGLDRRFRTPRVWSNRELSRFSHLFQGSVINVSAWRDEDKEGSRYESYFINASSYAKSNFDGARGLAEGSPDSIELDLLRPLKTELSGAFDVVFNHTTLEHIYDFRTAFSNLCRLSNDLVVLVVPFIQEQHGDYGDFWRFTPWGVRELFSEQRFTTLYLSCNDFNKQSIYVFAIASRSPENWQAIRDEAQIEAMTKDGVGGGFLSDGFAFRIARFVGKKMRMLGGQ